MDFWEWVFVVLAAGFAALLGGAMLVARRRRLVEIEAAPESTLEELAKVDQNFPDVSVAQYGQSFRLRKGQSVDGFVAPVDGLYYVSRTFLPSGARIVRVEWTWEDEPPYHFGEHGGSWARESLD